MNPYFKLSGRMVFNAFEPPNPSFAVPLKEFGFIDVLEQGYETDTPYFKNRRPGLRLEAWCKSEKTAYDALERFKGMKRFEMDESCWTVGEAWRVAGYFVLSGDLPFDFSEGSSKKGVSLVSLVRREDEDWPEKESYAFAGYVDSEEARDEFIRKMQTLREVFDVFHATDPPGKRIEFYSSSSQRG